MGSRGEAPIGGLGDFVPQKLEHFLNFIYIILMPRDSRCDKNGMNKVVQIFYRLENLEKKSRLKYGTCISHKNYPCRHTVEET